MVALRRVTTTLPASDLDRARSFYADKLGLKPVEELEGSLRYECTDGTYFEVFISSGASNGEHTQMGLEVEDLEAAVKELRANGLVFEEYDLPGFKTVDGIATIEGERGAWFKDSEGNLLAIAEFSR